MIAIRIPSAALLLASSLSLAASPGTVTGTFAPGERVSAPESHAPAHVSRTLVRSIVPVGGRATLEIPVRGGGGLIIWTIPSSDDRLRSSRNSNNAVTPVGVTLGSPSGRTLRADEANTKVPGIRRFTFEPSELAGLDLRLSGTQQVVHVEHAEAGLYHLELDAHDSSLLTVVAAEPESGLTLASWAGPLSRHAGEPVVLHAELTEGERPLLGARVSARLAAPGQGAGPAVELFDDGKHEDGAAGDGVYGASLAELPRDASGFWTVRYEAEGVDASGREFARTGSGGFMNERDAARLASETVKARFVGRGEERVLRVSARADVATSGDYRFDVIVSGAAAGSGDRPGLAWGESSSRLTAGSSTLTIDLPSPAIEGASGSALHFDIRLLALDPMGVASRVERDLSVEGR